MQEALEASGRHWSPGAGTAGSCKPPCMGAENQTWVLREISTLTSELSLQTHCVLIFKNYSVFFTEIVLTKMSICLLATMKESFDVDLFNLECQ